MAMPWRNVFEGGKTEHYNQEILQNIALVGFHYNPII